MVLYVLGLGLECKQASKLERGGDEEEKFTTHALDIVCGSFCIRNVVHSALI